MKLRVLTALGMALMAGALVLQYRPDTWERRVTDELMHAPSNHWPRPTLDPGSGHFGELVDADWNALRTLEENWSSIPADVRFECLKATSDLDLQHHFATPCRQWLDAARRHLPTVEHAVAAPEAGPPDRFDPLRGADSGFAARLMVLGRLPALEALSREAAGEHDRALDACVTTLEVIRDLEWGLRSTSDSLGERIGTLTFYPCAHALLNATPERRAKFTEQLAKVTDGRPPPAHGFELNRSTELLHFFGPTLPKKTLAGADPKVTAWLERNADRLQPKALQQTWADLSRHEDEQVELARQSPDRWPANNEALAAWKSVDAVFEGLKVIASLASQTAEHNAWPDPLPQGKQVKLAREGEAVTVLLDLRTHPVQLKDGTTFDLPNRWTLTLPQ